MCTKFWPKIFGLHKKFKIFIKLFFYFLVFYFGFFYLFRSFYLVRLFEFLETWSRCLTWHHLKHLSILLGRFIRTFIFFQKQCWEYLCSYDLFFSGPIHKLLTKVIETVQNCVTCIIKIVSKIVLLIKVIIRYGYILFTYPAVDEFFNLTFITKFHLNSFVLSVFI